MMSFLSASRLIAVAMLFFVAVPASAGYYKWTDENGVTHFSDAPPGSDGKPVRPNGTTVIPMRENIRTQKRVERIRNTRPAPSQVQPATTRVVTSKIQREKEEKLRDEKRQQLRCKQYENRIAWIDSRLRAGGYSVSEGNRLRKERRELSKKLAWECLRD